jgi:predicted AlkP superfamily phosphohydrolase/phosphomutase
VLPDRLGHPWWKYLVPGEAQYDTRKGKRLRRAAVRPLRALDHAVGDLLEEMPPSTAVLLCSDHGFGPLHGEVFFDVSLARAGLIDAPAAGPFMRTLATFGRSSASAIVPSALRRWTRTRLQHEGTDASKQAWTAPAYERGVRLADPANDAVRDRGVRLLQDLRDPAGNSVFKAVHRRDEVFHGPLADEAPDLICEPSSEAIDLHDGLHAPDPWVPRDSFAWGTHAVDGVVAVKGASAGDVIDGRAADIAPTVLRLLGLDAPGLDGASLVRGSGERLQTVPASDQGGPTPSYSQQQEDEVLDHLRALGYVE